MYAISTLKAPMTTTLCQLLGDSAREITSQKLARLVSAGWVERKPYGKGRIMHMLSLAGSQELRNYLANNPDPVLCEVRAQGTNAHRAKVGFTPKPELPKIAQPRQLSWKDGAPYETPKDAYYRNDGNKHIQSRGF